MENPKISNESETSNRIADKNRSLFLMVYILFVYSITDHQANTLVVNLWKSEKILRQLEISNNRFSTRHPFSYS